MSHLKRDALAYLRHCRVPGSSAPRAKFWWFADCIQYDNQLSFKKKAPPILFERNSRRADSFISKNEGMNEGHPVNARLKLPENQRFENVVFFALLGRILWFDPRREYSSIPTAKSRSRRAQGLSRLAASSRPPAGLGLDWPEHGGILDRIGAGGAHHIIGKFKPLVLGEIHAAGDTG